MTTSAFIIFPHQLFKNTKAIEEAHPSHIVLVEHPVFFGWRPVAYNATELPKTPMNFNKLKLVLHKASMQYYRDYLKKADHITIEEYIRSGMKEEMPLSKYIRDHDIRSVIYYDPVDIFLETLLNAMFHRLGVSVTVLDTPNFINKPADIEAFTKFKGKKAWYHATFYGWSRRHHNVLMTKDGKFVGGKLSFDMDNRKPLPKNMDVPTITAIRQGRYIKAACRQVEATFPNNIGNTKNVGHLLVTHAGAEKALANFISSRLKHFGDYEDAMSTAHRFLFHSVLSSAINIGLLDPMEIVRAIESRHSVAGIHNVEGFIRQVLGWREFTRVLYRAEYRAMKTKNVFQFSRVLTPAWYEGTTGLKPVDDVIRQAIDWGYLHHIQRLMVMGNILSLVHISPDEAYRWFMEFAIDSYDWVMISNVYGMASHSDEGITTTKPYVSSSNYILGMSDWKADGRWDVDWRTLYYNFIGTLRLPNGDYYFAKNRRTAIAWRNWERLGVEEQRAIMARGKEIIGRLTGD